MMIRYLLAAVFTLEPFMVAAEGAPVPTLNMLRTEFAAYFETSMQGSHTCYIPQHYAFRGFYELNLRSRDDGSKPIPRELVDHLNSDDTYSILTIHEGRGVYFRYFGYRYVSNEVGCF